MIKKAIILLVVLSALGGGWYFMQTGGGATGADWALHAVQARTLVIETRESGTIAASDTQVIRSEVEGRATIIGIVPQGTLVTAEDVEAGLVLVEMDSSSLRQREAQQDVQVQQALADYHDAKESLDIQTNQNESNLRQSEMSLKFALMDLEKYLGAELASSFVAQELTMRDLSEDPRLGGEALQEKRRLLTEIDFAEEETARARVKLEWTRQLVDKGYQTRDELQADTLALKRQEVKWDQSRTALDLFEQYTFLKEAEKLRADYEEAQSELERTLARNRAELAKADSRLNSTSATLTSRTVELDHIRAQIAKCRIVATQPGMVLYATGDRHRDDRQIAEGFEVHERQEILQIPSSDTMVVSVSIHESAIARVKVDQHAHITVDAIPHENFSGKVTTVNHLPDSSSRWFSSNQSLYSAQVAVNGHHEAIKPGMSAQVRIVTNELPDVLVAPIQAVHSAGRERFCFVLTPTGPTPVSLVTGEYNDNYIEIKDGLSAGQRVVLNAQSLARDHAERLRGRSVEPAEQPDEETPAQEPVPDAPAISHQQEPPERVAG